jgi:hypothetical protein
MRTRRRTTRRTCSIRRATLAAGVASALLAACSATGDAGDAAAQAPVTEDSAPQTESGDPDEVDEPSSNLTTDMCDVVSPDDIASVLETAAGTELIIGEPTPLVAGECSFNVERTGTGAGNVQVRVGDDTTFAHHRSTEEVTDLPGLGDEAYTFRGVAGPELHVRAGDVWLGVRFGSYDDLFGFTEDSHGEIAAVVLDRLAGG